MEKHTQKYP